MTHPNDLPSKAASTSAAHPPQRIHRALTASAERRVLAWLAPRLPCWVSPDQLTLLAFLAQCGAGACYALAGLHPQMLWGAVAFTAANWFGDSLDGTLARLRRQERPRYGFYVDHISDVAGATVLMTGLAISGLAHCAVAISMLLGFLLLSAESFLAASSLGEFALSQGPFGPTEIRLLLLAGDVAVLHNRYCTLFHHRVLLMDVGGTIASASMALLLLSVTFRHSLRLYREEPVPRPAPKELERQQRAASFQGRAV